MTDREQYQGQKAQHIYICYLIFYIYIRNIYLSLCSTVAIRHVFSVSEVSVVECVEVNSGCGLHSVYSRLRSVVKQVKERKKEKASLPIVL